MTRRKYTREFKEQAVRLSHMSGKSVAQVAADLGINANMLDRWRREQRESQAGQKSFPGNGHARDEELLQLRKALKQAELERDLLKKAVAFFARQAQ